MQYILTQEEYDKLNQKVKDVEKSNYQTILDLCQMVSDNMIIGVSWSKEKEPWGCILTKGEDNWYCDECPVKKVCPYKYKNWSK